MYVFDFRQLEDITTAAKTPMAVLNEDENTGNERKSQDLHGI